jgi:hypothetical protein
VSVLEIEGGDLHATDDPRVRSGLILPFGETGRTNRGRVSVRAGAVEIPADPAVVTYNLDHERNQPVGRAIDLHAREAGAWGPAGIYGSLRIAETPEGDDLLAEITDDRPGARRRLSAEVTGLVIRAGEIVRGRLYGVAAVTAGAYPSASLLAAAVPDEGDDEDPEAEAAAAGDEPDEPDDQDAAETEPDEVVTVDVTRTYSDEWGVTTTTETSETTYTHQPKEPSVPAATVAPDLAARAKTQVRGVSDIKTTRDLFAALAQANRSHDEDLHAALGKITSASHTPHATAPEFVGELWDGVGYERQYIPLFNHADLTSWKINGWKWKVRPTVGKYAGNLAEAPTNTPETEAVSIDAERIAGVHSVDRKFRDFGDLAFIESFYRAQAESYSEVSDLDVLDQVVTAAGARQAIIPGRAPADAPAALVALVQGYFKVFRATRRRPTFALMSDDLYEPLLFTTQYEVTPYLESLLNLAPGSLNEGFLRPTVDLDPDSVLVGVKDAVTVHEFGGGAPIRVSAIDAAKGGEDEGVFGYTAVNTHASKGLALMDAGTVPNVP